MTEEQYWEAQREAESYYEQQAIQLDGILEARSKRS